MDMNVGIAEILKDVIQEKEIEDSLKEKGIKQFIFEIKKNNEASVSSANSIATKINADPNLLSYRFLADTDDL